MIFKPLSLVESVVNSTTKNSDLPTPNELVKALLEIEKTAKKSSNSASFSDLTAVWNLRFITGTKKSRKRAGIALGAGKYIPQLLKIQIAYEQDPQQPANLGRVKNTVKVGFIKFSLTGPAKFINSKNILAFDFTTILIKIFGKDIYSGYIRNGAQRETEFYHQKISKQAFFSYFLIQENVIAARGRGGGLALWVKDSNRQ